MTEEPATALPSVLFQHEDAPALLDQPPDYFVDLQLNAVAASLTRGRSDYELEPFFYTALADRSEIEYRQAVFRDLEDEALVGACESFATAMHDIRERLDRASKVRYRHEAERWFLDAASAYCDAARQLASDVADRQLSSTGLRSFREFLTEYVASADFARLETDAEHVSQDLSSIQYRLRMEPGSVAVSRDGNEPDYGAEVVASFEKFKQAAEKEYKFKLERWPFMNHVEAAILERVALLYPQPFAALDAFAAAHAEFIDVTISRFDREIQFYLAYREHVAQMVASGLRFCYPELIEDGGGCSAMAFFDLALAAKLTGEGKQVVVNDFELAAGERILVISGPNQGGKTTFARAIGQLHHLARLGVLVPGESARLRLVDRIATHFERQERVEDLTSKLEADLLRIRAILGEASPESLLIMNESFTSTTLDDQVFIGERVMHQIAERGVLCVMVTFLDELASFDKSTVSMVSTVDPDEPARRTFKIVRRKADGLAYAMALAEKHRLTYRDVKTRLER